MATKSNIVKRVKKAARLQKRAKFARKFGALGRKYEWRLNRKQSEALVGREAVKAMFRIPEKHSFGDGWDLCAISQPAPYPDLSVRRLLANGVIWAGLKFSPGTRESILLQHGAYIEIKVLPSRNLMINPGKWKGLKEAAEQFIESLNFPKNIKLIKDLDVSNYTPKYLRYKSGENQSKRS